MEYEEELNLFLFNTQLIGYNINKVLLAFETVEADTDILSWTTLKNIPRIGLHFIPVSDYTQADQ